MALCHEGYSDNAVGSPLPTLLARYLRACLLSPGLSQPAPATAQEPQDGAARLAAEPPAPAAAAPASPLPSVAALRERRVVYGMALMTSVGEYVEVLGPVLAEQGHEWGVAALRRYAAVSGHGLAGLMKDERA